METGSAGIESNLSVFIQPTLLLLIKYRKKTLSEKVSFLLAFLGLSDGRFAKLPWGETGRRLLEVALS